MATTKTLTQGHIAVYAKDARWRRSMAKGLEQAGHSYRGAASPTEMRELLIRQRFDVLTAKVYDEEDARELAGALEGVPLPLHGILVGSVSGLTLLRQAKRAGSFRYVPGVLRPRELSRLVDASISAGGYEEGAPDNGPSPQIEEVDLEEAIESAAAAVYRQAKRKQQRFHTVVEGPSTNALANPARLRRALITLLKLVVELAPRGGLVSVQARAARDEWAVRIRAPRVRTENPDHLTEALRHNTEALTAVTRDVRLQGGLLWVELSRAAAFDACLTLPLPPEGEPGHP